MLGNYENPNYPAVMIAAIKFKVKIENGPKLTRIIAACLLAQLESDQSEHEHFSTIVISEICSADEPNKVEESEIYLMKIEKISKIKTIIYVQDAINDD